MIVARGIDCFSNSSMIKFCQESWPGCPQGTESNGTKKGPSGFKRIWKKPYSKKAAADSSKRGAHERPIKNQEAKVNAAMAETTEKAPRECKSAKVLGCTGVLPPWMCKAFGVKTPEERKKIIRDNNLCPFCQLHSMRRYAIRRPTKPSPQSDRSQSARSYTSSGLTI
jgi:hypothetical protein